MKKKTKTGRVYIPVVDCIPSKRAYTDKKTAEKALNRAYSAYMRKNPCMAEVCSASICYLDSYILIGE